ncbi:TPA: hypothetical protein RSV18_002118 [Pseudomonas aeruginosa]|nr:hypothetical protein [Pseudomonas aeruginosa]
MNKALDLLREIRPSIPKEVLELWCKDRDAFLASHPAVEQADVAAKLTFINGRPAMCGCQVEYSDGGGEYSDVIYVTLCAKHSGSAILDLVATNRIALTPEYEGQWHADLYLDREIPLAKVEGATPAEAVLALMSAERIDPEQESVEQAGGDEHVSLRGAANLAFNALHECVPAGGAEKQYSDAIRALETALRDIAYSVNRTATPQQFSDHLQREARAALAQPSPAQPSPAQAEQAEAERPEVVAYFDRNYPSTGDAFIWSNYEGSPYEPVMTVAQHERIVVAEKGKTAAAMLESHRQFVRQFEEGTAELIAQRDAALARVEQQERTIAGMNEAHAKLAGLYEAAQAQHSVPEEFSFEYRHPNGESHTVTVSRDQVINEMPDFLFEALCSKFCNCEPVGETNVVECCCDEYAEEFKLLAAAPVCRLSRSALTDAQMRRLYDSSTETENERLGFAAFARLIRRAEAVHQIAAAPGKEVGHE